MDPEAHPSAWIRLRREDGKAERSQMNHVGTAALGCPAERSSVTLFRGIHSHLPDLRNNFAENVFLLVSDVDPSLRQTANLHGFSPKLFQPWIFGVGMFIVVDIPSRRVSVQQTLGSVGDFCRRGSFPCEYSDDNEDDAHNGHGEQPISFRIEDDRNNGSE